MHRDREQTVDTFTRIRAPGVQKNFWKLILFLLSFVVISGFASQEAMANIANTGKTVYSKDYQLGEEYRFMPVFTSGKSTITTFGAAGYWSDRVWTVDDNTRYRTIDVNGASIANATARNSWKGQIGAVYSKVGYYDGYELDLKITITDWVRHGYPDAITTGWDAGGRISFGRDEISMVSSGMKWVETKWEFVRTGTSTVVPVSGYFTFSDIDVSQGIQFDAATWGKIDYIFVGSDTNRLKYAVVTDTRSTGAASGATRGTRAPASYDAETSKGVNAYKIYDVDDTDRPDGTYDDNYAFTLAYRNTSSMTFKWTHDFYNRTAQVAAGGIVGNTRLFYRSDYSIGDLLFYTMNKPSQTRIPEITKTVNRTTAKAGDTVTYTLNHHVPSEPSNFYYKSYVVKDSVDTALTGLSVSVKDASGANVTNWFDISTTSNNVVITRKAANNNAAFYNNSYTFTISGTVNASTVATKTGGGSSYIIRNTASVTVTSYNNAVTTKTSSEVNTTVNSYTVTTIHRDQDGNIAVVNGATTVGNTVTKYVDGTPYSTAFGTFTHANGNAYVSQGTAPSGTIDGKSLTFTLNYRYRRNLRVQHVNADTNAVFNTTGSEALFTGTAYSKTPQASITSGGVVYLPESTDAQTGTITADKTLTFKYVPPRAITVTHKDADTGAVLQTDKYSLYPGATYTYKALTTLTNPAGESYQPKGTTTRSGTVAGSAIALEFTYTQPRTVTTRHVDRDTGTLIATNTQRVHEGKTYTTSHRTDLTNPAGDSYQPVSTNPQTGTPTGTVGTADIVVTYAYTQPRIITTQHIDFDTNAVIATNTQKVHEGKTYTAVHRTNLTTAAGDSYQPRSTAPITGTVAASNITVKFFYTRPRVITINHIDDVTNAVILKETFKVHDGKTYSYTPRTNLTRADGRSYKPRTGAVNSGTVPVPGADFEINQYYFVPRLTVTATQVNIHTKKQSSTASQGLPVEIFIDKQLQNGAVIGDFAGGTVQVQVWDTTNNREAYSTNIAIASLGTQTNGALTTAYLAKGAKVNYEVRVSIPNRGTGNYDLVSTVPTIATHGYVASEYTVTTLNSTYTGVIRTSRTGTNPIIEDKETLTANSAVAIAAQKTGYGFSAGFGYTYTNDFGNLPSPVGDIRVDSKMIDSKLTYAVSGTHSIIPLTRMTNTVSNGGKTVAATFELPEVFVEKDTGYLFRTNTDAGITKTVTSGGRKFYVPVWPDALGTYDMFYESAVMGVNQIRVQLSRPITLNAYMFHHTDSPTKDNDELLLYPMNPDDPDFDLFD